MILDYNLIIRFVHTKWQKIKAKLFQQLLLSTGITLFLIDSFYIVDAEADESFLAFINQHSFVFLFFLIPAIYIYIQYLLDEKTAQLTLMTKDKKELLDQINKYVEVAKKMGQGQLDNDLRDYVFADDLGEALYYMQENLKQGKLKDEQNNWFLVGKERISELQTGYHQVDEVSLHTLVSLIDYIHLIQGAVYLYEEDTQELVNVATYAYNKKRFVAQRFKVGYGLIGQCAYEKATIYRKEIPSYYMSIKSGLLGEAKPQSLLLIPLIADNKLQGVIELASLAPEIEKLSIVFAQETAQKLAQSIFNLVSNEKTKAFLAKSQNLAQDLQNKQRELIDSSEQVTYMNSLLEKSYQELEEKVEEIKFSEKRIQSILEHSSETISIYTANAKLKYESASVKQLLKRVPSEMATKEGVSFIHEPVSARIKDIIKQLILVPYHPISFEYRLMLQEGGAVWCETTARNFMDNPAIAGILFTTRDITVHKHAELEKRMKGQMQALSENSPDIIVRIGVDGRVFYANPAFEQIIGIKLRQVTDKKIKDVLLPKSCFHMLAASLEAVIGQKAKIEQEFSIEVNKATRILMTSGIPEYNEEKEIESVLIVAHDITARKLIELEIQDKNKKIEDSINYAKRIQKAIMPTQEMIKGVFPQSFMIYKPKDVVSGDFPWLFQKGDNVYIAVVDCTGHGVPGALMSVIGYFLLNNIVDHAQEYSPAEILNRLHKQVQHSLKQNADGETRDGMDVALCKINVVHQTLEFAGAHRPLYHVRKQELTEYKGDRKAIGGVDHKKALTEFTNQVIPVIAGDRIIMFSDGFTDQEGGEESKKYGPKRVRDVLVGQYDVTIGEQSRLFEQEFKTWKGDRAQLDDVLLMGIQF